MKDDEYFGFSTHDDFKVVNLPEDVSGGEDDFKLVDVVDFGTEDDVRIVRLRDVSNFHDVAVEQDAKRNWMSQINSMRRKD
ncbi:MAG TPA: hypothetical protein VNG51_10480 [Ktedonobacteraceae bacterium]|nr:hypothetical protein [Ktedonobacteraceae bacterium]